MTEETFEIAFAAARKRHIDLMNDEAAAKLRNIEAIEQYTAMVKAQAEPNKIRYEYYRQAAVQADDWQPVTPGPEWDLWTVIETEQVLSYFWRRERSDAKGGPNDS